MITLTTFTLSSVDTARVHGPCIRAEPG